MRSDSVRDSSVGQASNVIIAKFVQQNANKILLQKIMGKSAKSANLPTK